jgi:Leucine rich repeat N-terminal domain
MATNVRRRLGSPLQQWAVLLLLFLCAIISILAAEEKGKSAAKQIEKEHSNEDLPSTIIEASLLAQDGSSIQIPEDVAASSTASFQNERVQEEESRRMDWEPIVSSVASKRYALHAHERRALFVIFDGLGGTNHLKTAGKWLDANTDHCAWKGITCQTVHHKDESDPVPVVTRLELPYIHLEGTIPTELVELKYLTVLHLSNNVLTGSIPTTLSQLSHLQLVHLTHNALTGTLPAFHAVRELSLSANFLTGRIRFTSHLLHLLDLSDNLLTGTLPESLNLLTALSFLILSDNALTGTLPDLRGMSHLRTLDVSNNLLSGTISELPASTWHVIAAENRMSGPFPVNLQSLPNLHSAVLSGNQFAGTLPVLWEQQTQLGVLLLDHNQFKGTLPLTLFTGQAANLGLYVEYCTIGAASMA